MNTITEETITQLYEKFGYNKVDRLLPYIPDLKLTADKMGCLYQSNLERLDWESEANESVEYRVEAAYIFITAGAISQNKICNLLKLSPVTYRKYRDQSIEDLKESYTAASNVIYNGAVKLAVSELILYEDTLDSLGIKNIDTFNELMNKAGYGDNAEDMITCYNELTEDEKRSVCQVC
jgi:hypothetical protein